MPALLKPPMTNNMTTLLFRIACLCFALGSLSSCSDIPVVQAKAEIQQYLEREYPRFRLDSIEKNYSKDLFRQETGFQVWLKDKADTRFGPVYFQKNKSAGGWITYMGSDVEDLYRKELQKRNGK